MNTFFFIELIEKDVSTHFFGKHSKHVLRRGITVIKIREFEYEDVLYIFVAFTHLRIFLLLLSFGSLRCVAFVDNKYFVKKVRRGRMKFVLRT